MQYPEAQIGPSTSNLMNIKFRMSKTICKSSSQKKIKKWKYQQKHATHALLT